MPKGTGSVVVGGNQASQPALPLVPVIKAPDQGGTPFSVLEGQEGMSFTVLYTGMMAHFDQQQSFLLKMK